MNDQVSRLNKLKSMRARRGSTRGGADGTEFDSDGGSPVSRNTNGGRAPGGSVQEPTGLDRPWVTQYGPQSLLVQLPTEVMVADGGAHGSDDAHAAGGPPLDPSSPNLRWRISLWHGGVRLTDDHICELGIFPGMNPTRLLRFNLQVGPLSVVNMRVEVTDGHASLAYASVYLRLQQAIPATAITDAHSADAGDAVFDLDALVTLPVNVILFHPFTDAVSLVGTFHVTYNCCRATTPVPGAVLVPSLPMSPIELVQQPPRSDLYVSVHHLLDAVRATPNTQLTLVVALSKGNGELLIAPQLLGTAGVDAQGAWFGDWQRMVKLSLPTSLDRAGESDVHLLFYMLAPAVQPKPPKPQRTRARGPYRFNRGDPEDDVDEPETPEADPNSSMPIVVGFAYLMLQTTPGLYIRNGQYLVHVYRGCPPFVPCHPNGAPLFQPTPVTTTIGGDVYVGDHLDPADADVFIPPHLRLLVPEPPAPDAADAFAASATLRKYKSVDTYAASLTGRTSTPGDGVLKLVGRAQPEDDSNSQCCVPVAVAVQVDIVSGSLIQDINVFQLCIPPQGAHDPLDVVLQTGGHCLSAVPPAVLFSYRVPLLQSIATMFARFEAHSASHEPGPDDQVDALLLHTLVSVLLDMVALLNHDALCSVAVVQSVDDALWTLPPPRLVWHALVYLQLQVSTLADALANLPASRQGQESQLAASLTALVEVWCALVASATRHALVTGTLFGIASDPEAPPLQVLASPEEIQQHPLGVLTVSATAALQWTVQAWRICVEAEAALAPKQDTAAAAPAPAPAPAPTPAPAVARGRRGGLLPPPQPAPAPTPPPASNATSAATSAASSPQIDNDTTVHPISPFHDAQMSVLHSLSRLYPACLSVVPPQTVATYLRYVLDTAQVPLVTLQSTAKVAAAAVANWHMGDVHLAVLAHILCPVASGLASRLEAESMQALHRAQAIVMRAVLPAVRRALLSSLSMINAHYSTVGATSTSGIHAALALVPGTATLLSALMEGCLPLLQLLQGGFKTCNEILYFVDILPTLCAAIVSAHSAGATAWCTLLVVQTVAFLNLLVAPDNGGRLGVHLTTLPPAEAHYLLQMFLPAWDCCLSVLVSHAQASNPLQRTASASRAAVGTADPPQWVPDLLFGGLVVSARSAPILDIVCITRCVQLMLRAAAAHPGVTVLSRRESLAMKTPASVAATNLDNTWCFAFDAVVQVIQGAVWDKLVDVPAAHVEDELWQILVYLLQEHRERAVSFCAQRDDVTPLRSDIPELVSLLMSLYAARAEATLRRTAPASGDQDSPTAEQSAVGLPRLAEALLVVLGMEFDQSLHSMPVPEVDHVHRATAFLTQSPSSRLEMQVLLTCLEWIHASLAWPNESVTAHPRAVWQDLKAVNRVLEVCRAMDAALHAEIERHGDAANKPHDSPMGSDSIRSQASSPSSSSSSGKRSAHSGSGSDSDSDSDSLASNPTKSTIPQHCHLLRDRLLQFRHYIAVLRTAPLTSSELVRRVTNPDALQVMESADANAVPEALRALMATACAVDALYCPAIANTLVRVLGGDRSVDDDEDEEADTKSQDSFDALDVAGKWQRLASTEYVEKHASTGSKSDNGKSADNDPGDGGLEDGIAVAHTLAYKACVCHELWLSGKDWDALADRFGAADVPGVYRFAAPRGAALNTICLRDPRHKRHLRSSLSAAATALPSAETRLARLKSLETCYLEAILALDIAQEWDLARQLCDRLRQAYEHERALMSDIGVEPPDAPHRRVDQTYLSVKLDELRLLEDKIRTDCATKPYLTPMYCAVHFAGQHFPLVERGCWFMYRMPESSFTGELVARLQARYPFARVVTPRHPIVAVSPRQVNGNTTTALAAEMWFMGVPADPTSPCEDHIYVYSAEMMRSGLVSKNEWGKSVHGSQFMTKIARCDGSFGVAALQNSSDNASLHSVLRRASKDQLDLARLAAMHPSRPLYACSDEGPCLLTTHDLKRPLDEALEDPSLSPILTAEFFVENEAISTAKHQWRFGTADKDTEDPSVAVTVHLPWVTRRVAVTRTVLTPAPLVNSCMEWLQSVRDLLTNRLRWVYHASLWAEQPAAQQEPSSGGYPFGKGNDRPKSVQPDLSIYGAGGSKDPGVFGAGAVAKFDFPDSDSEDSVGKESVIVPGALPKYIYKAARTLAPTAAMRTVQFTTSSSLPVPKPQISPHLDNPRRKASDALPPTTVAASMSSRRERRSISGVETDLSVTLAVGDELEDGQEVVQASAAAHVIYCTLEEALHPETSFVCGIRACNQLLNDYRELHTAYNRASRTRMKKEYIRAKRAAEEKSEPAPEPPDFEALARVQPHWSIVRVERGVAGVMLLVEEASSIHSQLLEMEATGGSSSEASLIRKRRDERLTSLLNGIIEGFTVCT